MTFFIHGSLLLILRLVAQPTPHPSQGLALLHCFPETLWPLTLSGIPLMESYSKAREKRGLRWIPPAPAFRPDEVGVPAAPLRDCSAARPAAPRPRFSGQDAAAPPRDSHMRGRRSPRLFRVRSPASPSLASSPTRPALRRKIS